MIARVETAVAKGYDGVPVVSECDITKGLPAFNIVGLANKSIAESRERVRSAIVNSGFSFPAKRITINLAPPISPKTALTLTWRSPYLS